MDDAATSNEKKEDAPVEEKADEAAEKKADVPAAKEVAASAGECTPLTQSVLEEGGSPTQHDVLTKEVWSLVCSFLDVESTINVLCVSSIMKLLGSWEGLLLGYLNDLVFDSGMKLAIPDMEYTEEGSIENILFARCLWKVSTLCALYVTTTLQHQHTIPHTCFILHLLGLSTTGIPEYPSQDRGRISSSRILFRLSSNHRRHPVQVTSPW